MSSLKRKDGPVGSSSAAKSSKKTKSEDTRASSSRTETAETAAPRAKDPVAQLKEDEPLFPRGGGSILSPLEQKQIQIQAKQDALFEQEEAEESAATTTRKQTKGKRKSTSNLDKAAGLLVPDPDAVRIESLNFKQLVRGSLVLCQVCEINALELVLAMPNRLFGRVPITAVSKYLTKRVESAVAEDGDSDDGDGEGGDGQGVDGQGVDGTELASRFSVGQYVRAYVLSTMDEDTTNAGRGKKHIELSLLPELANSGLEAKDLVQNCTVMASVESAEDHGYVMDISISGSNIRGFLAKKEVDPGVAEERMNVGSTLLCIVGDKGSRKKTVQLSTLPTKLGTVAHIASDATTINTFLPGTAVEVLVSDVLGRGLVGKVMGSLDVTADLFHSGAGPDGTDLDVKYKVGSKFRARVICNFPSASKPKLGVSVLPHIASLEAKTTADHGKQKLPLDALASSAIVERCTITKVQSGVGVFVDVGVTGVSGFVPMAKLSDARVDSLFEDSGPFKVGSEHRGRVIGYSAVDGLFSLSFEKHILEQQYLRVADIPVGEVVHGQVDRFVFNEKGVGGMIVHLADGISGLVPATHFSDVQLKDPEAKFRKGNKVKARVLSADPVKNQLKLTLKKTLVNSEDPALYSYDQLSVGMKSLGTIVKIYKAGALVQFYGPLSGFLPISEMSEAFIQNIEEHFRIGQVVNVHILSVDAENKKLMVTCKDPSAFGIEKKQALKNLKLGDIVSAKVIEKTDDNLFVELTDSLLKASVHASHLADKAGKKGESALKRIYVGQTLSDLVVLTKHESRQALTLTHKPSLVKAAKEGSFPTSIESVKVGDLVHGFVRNITATAAFVHFAGNLTALLPKSGMDPSSQREADFGMTKYQYISVKITSVDPLNSRLVSAMPSVEGSEKKQPTPRKEGKKTDERIGKIVKAKVVSNNGTQLNVLVDDTTQGRIDVSEAFDSWDEIVDPKNPLGGFRQNQVLTARVLGLHETRSFNYLAFSHRATRNMLELSAKPSAVLEDTDFTPLTVDKFKPGSTWLGFVNNAHPKHLFVQLTSSVRGKIAAAEATDNLLQQGNLVGSFPPGTALQVRVLKVTPEGQLELSARSPDSKTISLTWDTIEKGTVLPAKVVRATDRQVVVHLAEGMTGRINLPDISDDFSKANPLKFDKNTLIKVFVMNVDKAEKKLRLSTRPSHVLNSATAVEDREITKVSDLEAEQLVRGFVKNTSDKGVFIDLGGDVTGFVKIKDLSDRFLKDWKAHFHLGQLVKGRVVSVDAAVGHVQLTLRPSQVDENYVAPLTIADFTEGQVVTGKVRKVEEFGVFIVLDDSSALSGLCHRSEMAEKPVKDATKLYRVGDKVKARVLKVDVQKKQMSLGLKPSYFEDEDSDMDVDDDEDDDGGALVFGDDDDDEEHDDDEDMRDADLVIAGMGKVEDSDEEGADGDAGMLDAPAGLSGGLDAGGFDWSGAVLDDAGAADDGSDDDADADAQQQKKKRKRRPEIQVDRTGELDAHGPQTATDYERLLLGQPDSSALWIAYMAFQMQVGELARAREVAERAIRTISAREERERLDVWIAFLNLEVAYGTEDALDAVFKRACEYNDEQVVHERLATIYIQSGKNDKADDLFQAILKKFGAKSPDVWVNYAQFLHVTASSPDRARALLPRAVRALESGTGAGAAGGATLRLTLDFARLEFRSPNGEAERGRTLFEGVLASYPRRFDLWGQLLSLETSAYAADKAKGEADAGPVREVFDRGLKVKGLKPKKAESWIRRWAEWEKENGDDKSHAKVTARAKEWVKEAEARKKAAAAAGAAEEDEE